MTREEEFISLGDHVSKVVASMPGLIGQSRAGVHDPLVLDKFALQSISVSQALAQLAERAQQLAESLLDDAEEGGS